MPRVCYFTGKKTTFGRQKTHRGKAKYLGGVGTKTTGISSRKFRPNIQKVRAIIDGRTVRVKVSVKGIRNGMIINPVRLKYVPAAEAAKQPSSDRAGSARDQILPWAMSTGKLTLDDVQKVARLARL